MLTPRQQETIEHIKENGIETSDDIIKYCLKKLAQPRVVSYTTHPKAPIVPRRRHSQNYYHEIIKYYTGDIKV